MNNRKQKKRIASRRRILGLEQLERREVLAGNVAASIRGGNLFVTGDNLGNDITITCNGGNGITIVGNGTTVNGQAAATFSNFKKHVTVNMNGGDDNVTFRSTFDDLFTILGNMTVTTGGGNDRLNFADAHVKGVLFVDTGSGNDEVNGIEGFTGWSLRADKVATILTGTGNDVVSLNRARFAKTTSILLERDHDKLFLSNSFFLKTTVLNGGLGFDRLNTVNTSFSKKPIVVLFEVRGSNPPPSTNHPPVAVNDSATVAEGATTSIDVADNDTDADGSLDLDSIVIRQNPVNGSVTVNGDGTVTYTHNGSNTTSDSFRYTIKDDDDAVSGTATVNITITPVNDAPVAVDDATTTAEDTAKTLTQADLKGNDTDVDNTNAQLSVTAVSGAVNGTVVLNGDGTVTFTPTPNFNGTAGFDYTLSDGTLTDTGHVTVTVTATNDAPVAVDDATTTAEDTDKTLTQADLKGNDTDVDNTNAQLSVTAVSGAVNGTVVLNGDGTVTFTPTPNFNGTAGFDYTLSDGTLTDTGHVTVTVTATNDAPVAVDDATTTAEDTDKILTQADLKGNDTDVDNTNAQLSVTAVSGAVNGTVVLNGDGTVTFTPTPDFSGTAGFDYTLSDGTLTDTGHVTVTVTPVNDAPVASDGTLTTAEDTPATGTLVATDVDTAPVVYSLVDQSNAHGTVTITDPVTGAYSYSPDLDYSGPASFTFKANDGTLDSNTATISITVTAANDAPVAVDDATTTAEDTDKTLTQADLKGNDTDVDNTNAQLSVNAVSGAVNGTVVLNGDGTVTFSPTPNFNGTAGFDYTLSDGTLTDTGHVTVTVTAANDPPVALDDATTTAEDTDKVLTQADLKGNDTDVDNTNAQLSVTAVSGAVNGTVVLNGDGTVTFTPTPDFSGTAGFDYTLSDGSLTDTGHVTVTVTAANDAPVAVDDATTTAEDTDKILTQADLKGNDTDVDNTNAELSVTAVSGAVNGTVVLNGDGTVTFTPTPDFSGTAGFDYTLSDGSLTDTGHVTVTVTPVNDAPVAQDGTLITSVDTPATGTLVATDVDTAPVVYSLVDQSNAHGTVTITDPVTGAYSYSPDLGYTGPASFTFKANDGTVDSNIATISITVTS